MSNFYPIKRPDIYLNKIDQFFETFSTNLFKLNTTIAQRDKIVKLCIELVSEVSVCLEQNIETNDAGAKKMCKTIHGHAIEQLQKVESNFKRQKIMKKSKMYVEPVEMSSGFEFVTAIDENSGKSIRSTVQRTFQYVPLLKTLESLFSDVCFEKLYIDYNKSDKHRCKDGVYERFCCGSVYQNNDFFKLNPMAIQLKVFVDDFEPCDALKSRSGKHKTTGFYLQINNLPKKFESKVATIYLLALCDASDSKTEYANTDNVLETIVKDIHVLEKIGILTKSGLNIKGSLICAMHDNLGGNILFGLHGSFSSNHFCRICYAPKQRCQEMTIEDPDMIRTVENYEKCLATLESNTKEKDTKGIKSYCHLNDLSNYHIMKNFTVDIMHDILEGMIPFTLENLFKICVSNKIATLDQIQGLIDCFNHGNLHKSSKPSKINIEKKNLGQNASQSYCLFINLPFILFKFREKLREYWAPYEYLQQILQIVSSNFIHEIDILRLENTVQLYLEAFKTTFQTHLRPKHHLLTHYVRVIRAMGPVASFWVMRMESKHQIFKHKAQQTKNFINLKKTMAQHHQENLCLSGLAYMDDIEASKKTSPLECCSVYQMYESTFKQVFTTETIEGASVLNSLRINNIKYRPNFLIIIDNMLCEIDKIIMHSNQFWIFSSHTYNVKEHDTFLNSFLLEKENKPLITNLLELEDMCVFEIKYLKEKPYIVVENLKLFYLHNK